MVHGIWVMGIIALELWLYFGVWLALASLLLWSLDPLFGSHFLAFIFLAFFPYIGRHTLFVFSFSPSYPLPDFV